MEKLTYQQLKAKANKALNIQLKRKYKLKNEEYKPFTFSQKEVLLWATLHGYRKQKIQINKIRKIYYVKHDNI